MSLVAFKQKKNVNENFLSFLFSLFVHALLFFLFGMTFLRFQHATPPASEPIPQETPPEVIFDLTPPPQHQEVLVTSSEHPLEKAPEHAAFQSHENTEAATELPPTGTEALPTLAGEKQDILSLKQADYETGENNTTSATSIPAQPSEAITSNDHKAIPVAEAKPTPVAPDQPIMGTLSSAAKNNQETSRTSVVHGNISNKGKSSVAAEATPLGRYKKTLSDAISSRWRYYIDNRMELLSFGTATISFLVTQQGKIESLHLLSNSSNQTFADCCIKSIMEAKLPPIPPEVAATLQDKKLEVEYRFTICTDTTF